MPNAGITRFVITDTVNGLGGWRFRKSRERWDAASKLYRHIFEEMGMPLVPGDQKIECTKNEFEAGYDYALGIDVVFTFNGGMESTLQEKFLFTHYKTVTVEYMQDWRSGEQGDWFKLRAQYYFVGYDRNDSRTFQDWILLDWPSVQRATSKGQIAWKQDSNKHDGAKASFKYLEFDEFPLSCIVTSSNLIKPRQADIFDIIDSYRESSRLY